ncbi:A-kinase anchor protein 17A [Pimephales promelas]|uniref:A-kinase anchor protein 17A n=1 Tax=Pimephales promelas TaxID=90988 RepID=UPI001955D8BE|nr:A-kinase anchor protein 17A [Pimephales promelas]KAG1927820.1 A-kinase anchor protein 17B [Pimephales promelas]KAG1927821.1 A-kinase anchor protein 17B [Pimephales promelas]
MLQSEQFRKSEASTMTSIVTDTAEAVDLCPENNLYLKPIAKMTISVALPHLKMPGKSISNWEVMERLKSMAHPDQFSSLRISKSTMDFIRFDGEVENRSVVKRLLSKLEGKSIKLSGFTDVLKVRTAENKTDFPTRHDWDSFFRDAKDMNETVPGERPDTVHLEGLPCKWFAQKDGSPDKPSEAMLKTVFERFGKIRNVDIPMLDPYREEMTGKNFNTFSFGGHLNFEGYVQYLDHTGFVKAMDSLRGMKLMLKGDDGKAVACSIKVTFDTTKHLSDSSLKKRQQERLKLQELEKQREEQKRREKEEEERRKEDERKQREQEELEKERKREEKLRKREQKIKEKEEKKNQKKMKKQQEEEQKKLHQKIVMEERKLLLAQRNLESIRLIAELLSRAKSLKQQQQEQQKAEQEHLRQLEESRRQQEEELRRVEAEKKRTLELQRKERELRDRLLGNLLKKSTNTDEIESAPVIGLDLQICHAQVNGGEIDPDNQDSKPKKPESVEERADGERRERRNHTRRHERRSQSRGRRSHSSGKRSKSRGRRSHSNRRRSHSTGTRSHSNGRRSPSHEGRSHSHGRRSHSRNGRRSRTTRHRRHRARKDSHGPSSSKSRSSNSRSRSSSRGRRRHSRHRSRRH